MISAQDAIDQFKAIIGIAESWARLAKSQFVEHLAIFQSWALRDAQWKIERTGQEFFLSTALNDSSIQAHAEDREYLPRKRVPAHGTVRITNNGAAKIVIPGYQEFLSSPQLTYSVPAGATLQPGAFADLDIQQEQQMTLETRIATAKPFYEILFDAETSGKLSGFAVYVDNDGTGYRQWTYAQRFQNTDGASEVYDEFYSHTGQTGIRFGNGSFGATPQLNAKVKIDYWVTEGETTLMPGQQLQLVGSLSDANGAAADLSIVTMTAITEGAEKESIGEIRGNLHYWQLYNDKLVWDDDYGFFIRRRFPGITWIRCWGEEQQELESGFDVQNINRIFISAYAPGAADLGADILAKLAEVPLLNRRFTFTTPALKPFSIAVTGAVAKNVIAATAEAGIKKALLDAYGKDTAGRREFTYSDCYEVVKGTGYFTGTGAKFQIEVTGSTEPSTFRELVYLDPDQTAVNLTVAR